MKSKKQKVRWVLLLFVVPKRVDVISKCVVVGNLGICRINNVWRDSQKKKKKCVEGKKYKMDNDIFTHGALTFCYLKG